MNSKYDRTEKWRKLLSQLESVFGKKPKDINTILYLIGVQELGLGYREFSRDEKMEIFHIAMCTVLSFDGVYEFSHRDDEGWPHFNLIKEVDPKSLVEQAELLKDLILQYFEKNQFLA